MHRARFRVWVTVTVCSATVSVPVRDRPPLEATLNVTVPVPVPQVPPDSEIHDALLLADHSHPEGAVTDVERPLVAVAETENVRGETVKLAQLGGAAGGAPGDAAGGAPGGAAGAAAPAL